MLHAAFDLEPAPVDTDYLLGFRTAASWKRSLVLVFTDLFEEAAAQPLVASRGRRAASAAAAGHGRRSALVAARRSAHEALVLARG